MGHTTCQHRQVVIVVVLAEEGSLLILRCAMPRQRQFVQRRQPVILDVLFNRAVSSGCHTPESSSVDFGDGVEPTGRRIGGDQLRCAPASAARIPPHSVA
jgi:hypothetical protein